MNKKVFDAERNEVRAAVLVTIMAMISILSGINQVSPSIAHARAGSLPMIQEAAQNLEISR